MVNSLSEMRLRELLYERRAGVVEFEFAAPRVLTRFVDDGLDERRNHFAVGGSACGEMDDETRPVVV